MKMITNSSTSLAALALMLGACSTKKEVSSNQEVSRFPAQAANFVDDATYLRQVDTQALKLAVLLGMADRRYLNELPRKGTGSVTASTFKILVPVSAAASGIYGLMLSAESNALNYLGKGSAQKISTPGGVKSAGKFLGGLALGWLAWELTFESMEVYSGTSVLDVRSVIENPEFDLAVRELNNFWSEVFALSPEENVRALAYVKSAAKQSLRNLVDTKTGKPVVSFDIVQLYYDKKLISNSQFLAIQSIRDEVAKFKDEKSGLTVAESLALKKALIKDLIDEASSKPEIINNKDLGQNVEAIFQKAKFIANLPNPAGTVQ